jgi:23S rRNA (uracil1939-C5)-methyltransferase
MAGETFDLELTDIAHGGSALGRHAGRVIFAPYAIPGERVRAQIAEERGRYAFARVLDVLEASPHRIAPSCRHFGPGKCGGCQWQHIDYAAQLAFKRQVVADQLTRIGKFHDPPVREALPGPSPWAYRAHMTFTACPDGQLGFWSDDNSRVVPIEECHILHPALVDLYNQLDLDLPTLERLRLQVGSDPNDRMLVLSTRDDLAPEIELDLPVSVNLLLADNEPVNLIGSSHVSYQVHGQRFRVTAGSFFQVNLWLVETLVDEALYRLDLKGGDTALDLYSGVGLFTAFMAEQAGLVVSVESYPPAASDADINLADLDNVDLVEGAVEAVLDDLEGTFEVALVDPPRAGLSPEVVDGLARLAPDRLVYVSCDPATLARDGGRLARQGYELVDVQPVDLFPQTFHIETVTLFVRA